MKNQIRLAPNMAGAASPEDSEPLFVLEPLPELGGVIDTFASANPLFLIVSMAAALYLLITFDDPTQEALDNIIRQCWLQLLCHRFNVFHDDIHQYLCPWFHFGMERYTLGRPQGFVRD